MKNLRLAVSSLAVIALTVGAIAGIGVLPATAANVTETIAGITYTADGANVSAGASVTSYSGISHTVVIPASVTIGSATYAVTSIGPNAFLYQELYAVTMPSSVTTIGNAAFAYNFLSQVAIPESVTTIDSIAFAGNFLRSVTIPSGVTRISNNAFSNNQLRSLVMPEGVTSIGEWAFYGNQLETVTIPNSVSTIGYAAFASNGLGSVTIPNSVTTISNYAFSENNLQSVNIGTGVTTIGAAAFFQNDLTTVTVPASVTALGENAFDSNHIKTVMFLGPAPTTTDWCFGYSPAAKVYYQPADASGFASPWHGYTTAAATFTTTVPTISGTAQVGNTLRALAWNWSPEPTTVSYSWKKSGSDVVLGWGDTYQPTAADVGATLTVTALGEMVGFPAASRTSVETAPVMGPSFTIKVNDITYAVESTNLSAGATVTKYSGDIAAVTIPASVTISGATYAVTTIGPAAFQTMKVTSVVIPSSVTTIGAYAFQSSGLSAVTIPSSVTTIGASAFSFNNLTSVSIPASVTSIGAGAFVANTLTSIVIGRGVQSIGTYAFAQNSLRAVTIPANVTSIGSNILYLNSPTSVLFLGAAPTISPVGSSGSFGSGNGITLSYLSPFASSFFSSMWSGYGVSLANFTIPTPTVSGIAQVGNTLTTEIGTWSPTPEAVTYAWTRSGDNTVRGQDATYVPTASDYGSTLIVTATALMPGGQSVEVASAPTAIIAPGTYTPVPTPTISGTIEVGQTLTAQSGPWPAGTTLTYAWRQASSDSVLGSVLGSGSFYTPTIADFGKNLTVTITAAPVGYTPAVATSAPTVAVAPGTFRATPTPTIFGTVQVGQSLTADAGSWPAGTTLTYAWKWSGTTTIIGTDSGYTPSGTDHGKFLTVTVTAAPLGYVPAVITSAPTATMVAPGTFTMAPTPTISGTRQVGKVLTAASGTWTSGAILAYAWKRSGSASTIGTAARYTPVATDMGKTLTVTVTATRDGFTTLRTTSASTAAIVGMSFTTAPVPTITGTKRFGSTVTAVTTGWAPSSGVTFTYVWKRASTSSGTKTTISGATSKTYKLVTADKGKYLTVTVVASKSGYASTTKTSANAGTKIAN